MGMYLLPELPHWGGVGRRPKTVEGDVEQKRDVYDNTTEYLIKEGYRLFDEFGNHASFVMFEIEMCIRDRCMTSYVMKITEYGYQLIAEDCHSLNRNQLFYIILLIR